MNANGDSKVETRDSKIDMRDNVAARHGDRSESDNIPRRPTIHSLDGEEEPTTLEKIWQPLFDVNGEPTERLGQFLRGIALHIIDDYEPKKSLVIAPAKLKKFYEDVKLDDDTYPWRNVFTLSNSSIAKIYRDKKIEHFYIQDNIDDAPSIPAMTPCGFQRWMTLHIQAHPQAEFERLQRVVREMPINNADNLKERFPKELSRRLLPRFDDLKTRQYCSAAIRGDGQITIPNHTRFPPPPVPSQSSRDPEQAYSSERERMPYVSTQTSQESSQSFPDRERMPYATQATQSSPNLAHDTVIHTDSEEDRENHKPVQIERERKPYTAKEGTGKVYETESASTSQRTLRTEPLSAGGRHRNSVLSDVGNHSDTSSRASDHRGEGTRRSRAYSHSSRKDRSPPPATSGYSKSSNTTNVYDREEDRHRERRDRSERRRADRDERREDRRDEREIREREERDRDRERERDRRERAERDERDREESYARRYEEEERQRRASRYEDGETLGRRSTVESGYPGPAYSQFQPLGTGERRYG